MRLAICAFVVIVALFANLRIEGLRKEAKFYEVIWHARGKRTVQIVGLVILTAIELAAICIAPIVFVWPIVVFHCLTYLAAIHENRQPVLRRLARACLLFGAGTPQYRAVRMFSAITSGVLGYILAFLVQASLYSAGDLSLGATMRDTATFVLILAVFATIWAALGVFIYVTSRKVYAEALEKLAIAYPHDLNAEQE